MRMFDLKNWNFTFSTAILAESLACHCCLAPKWLTYPLHGLDSASRNSVWILLPSPSSYSALLSQTFVSSPASSSILSNQGSNNLLGSPSRSSAWQSTLSTASFGHISNPLDNSTNSTGRSANNNNHSPLAPTHWAALWSSFVLAFHLFDAAFQVVSAIFCSSWSYWAM